MKLTLVEVSFDHIREFAREEALRETINPLWEAKAAVDPKCRAVPSGIAMTTWTTNFLQQSSSKVDPSRPDTVAKPSRDAVEDFATSPRRHLAQRVSTRFHFDLEDLEGTFVPRPARESNNGDTEPSGLEGI